jgi:hypothetical protein
MAGVRALAERVRKLEQARIPARSPFEQIYGSMAAFADHVQTDIDAGTLCRRDMPVVIACIDRWNREGAWGAWRRDRIWEHSG